MVINRQNLIKIVAAIVVFLLVFGFIIYERSRTQWLLSQKPKPELAKIWLDSEGTHVRIQINVVISRRHLHHFTLKEAEVDGRDIIEESGVRYSSCFEDGELPFFLPARARSNVTFSGLLELFYV